MTFQEILEGITRHRTNRATVADPEVQRKFEEIEWALQALAETLRDREQELKEFNAWQADPDQRLDAAIEDVDAAFKEYEKRE